MPCYLMRNPGQTEIERDVEVRTGIEQIDRLIAEGRVKVNVSREGFISFDFENEYQRRRLTDECIFRLLDQTASAETRRAIEQAQYMAGGVALNREAILSHGMHTHDGGATWHPRG